MNDLAKAAELTENLKNAFHDLTAHLKKNNIEWIVTIPDLIDAEFREVTEHDSIIQIDEELLGTYQWLRSDDICW